ncbi:MAG: hypothetical protein HGB35_06285, partial [Geobacteraceae bacterium]|nr:hypothetical protein [Geobacteraceae bacterium]
MPPVIMVASPVENASFGRTILITGTVSDDFNASGGKLSYRLVEAPRWLSIDSQTGLIRATPVE